MTILIVCEGVSQRQTARPQSKVSEQPLYIRAITATIYIYDILPSEPPYMATKATINGHQYHCHQRHRHQHHRHQLWTKTSFLWIATHLMIYKFLCCASSFEVHDHIWLKSQNYENFTQLFKSQIVPVHRQHWRLVVKLNLFFIPDPNIIPPNMIHFLVWFKFVLKFFQFFTMCEICRNVPHVVKVFQHFQMLYVWHVGLFKYCSFHIHYAQFIKMYHKKDTTD